MLWTVIASVLFAFVLVYVMLNKGAWGRLTFIAAFILILIFRNAPEGSPGFVAGAIGAVLFTLAITWPGPKGD